MTDAWRADVRTMVMGAVSRFMPEARVRQCEVRVLTPLGGRGYGGLRTLPLAEAAIVPFGSDAAIQIELVVDTPAGRESVELQITSS
jgi:hypothetical protein